MARLMTARVRCRRCGAEFVARASRADEVVGCSGCGGESEAASYEMLEPLGGVGGGGVSGGHAAGSALPVGAGRESAAVLPPSDLKAGRREDVEWDDDMGMGRGNLAWELGVESEEGRSIRESALARNRSAFTAVTTVLASLLAAGLLVLGISKHLYQGGEDESRQSAVDRVPSPVEGAPSQERVDDDLEQHLDAIRMAEVVEDAGEAASRFLAAGSAQERLEYITAPERHREEVERFHELYPGGLTIEGELGLERTTRLEESGGHIVLFAVKTSEARGEPRLFVVQESEGAPFKVDWQFFYQFHEGLLERFLEEEVGGDGEFFLEFTRVHAQGEIPPFGEHSLAYRILGVVSEDGGRYFFIDRRTGLGQHLEQTVGWQKAGATRVRLKWEAPDEGSGRKVPFLRLTWFEGYL